MITTSLEVESRFKIVYIKELEFFKDEILEKIKKKTTKKLKRKKYYETNVWAAHLFEKPLCLKKEIPYLIKKVNPLVGYGVFATSKISELSFIGEYTGVVRKRRFWGEFSNDYVFSYSIEPHDTPWVIDAREKGNFTRFINHSYEPNLTAKWIISGGVAHIILFANRLIYPGEQLTYDYGPKYWKKRSFPESF
jgi:SET domain-containing protein